jgi:hypothetical protein
MAGVSLSQATPATAKIKTEKHLKIFLPFQSKHMILG